MKDAVDSQEPVDCTGQLEVFMEKIQRRFQAGGLHDLEAAYLCADGYLQQEAAR